MPLYGFLTQKRSPQNLSFNNRYYVLRSNLAEAEADGIAVAGVEQIIFGSTVTIENIHSWKPNVSPNQKRNFPINLVGDFIAASPIKSEICAEIFWPVVDSNPCYKRYRVQVNATELFAQSWNTDMLDALEAFVNALNALNIPFSTLGGNTMGPASFNQQYVFQQTGKRWYNRTVSP